MNMNDCFTLTNEASDNKEITTTEGISARIIGEQMSIYNNNNNNNNVYLSAKKKNLMDLTNFTYIIKKLHDKRDLCYKHMFPL